MVEPKITDALVAAARRQITTGEGVLALVGVGDTLSLARYYFYGQASAAAGRRRSLLAVARTTVSFAVTRLAVCGERRHASAAVM